MSRLLLVLVGIALVTGVPIDLQSAPAQQTPHDVGGKAGGKEGGKAGGRRAAGGR